MRIVGLIKVLVPTQQETDLLSIKGYAVKIITKEYILKLLSSRM